MMDIVERLAQQAAETINGGEFNDGKWYTEGQRQAWRKAMAPAADEIARLRKENAELKELLQATVDYTGAVASSPNISFYPSPKWHLVTNGAIQEITIGKTTGDE